MLIPIRSSARALLLAAFVVAAPCVSRAARADDPMSAYRERFKTGLERYKAGAVAEAIRYWEPIYRELGASRGYRLAFDLARAYETYGDFTRAAELYASFVAEAEARRAEEPLVPLVEQEVTEARARLDELARTKGRINVIAGEVAVPARIDAGEARVAGFVAYVPPGAHEVVFGTGDHVEKRALTVGAGEIVDVRPTPVRSSSAAPPPPPAPLPVRLERRVERPFDSAILYGGAALTLASIAVPIVAYGSALAYERANKLGTGPDADARNASIRADYATAKTEYYVALAIPITLAVATCALTAWYFRASKEREVPVVVPGVMATKQGASLGLSGSF